MTGGEADEEPDAGVEVRRFAVSIDGHGQRLDKLLVAHAAEFSRSHLQGLIERGCVRVDGVVAGAASRRLRAGQEVGIELQPTDESRAFTPEAMALAIRFEDEHLLVLAKPAGLVVHPAPGHWRGTLLNGLLAHHRGASQLPRAGIVHRLDKDTSGLMVVAKTLPAMTALVRAMAAREVKREYLALVHGEVPAAPFSIEAAIGRDPVSRVRMAVVAAGKPRERMLRGSPTATASARCAARCTAVARTRSACTWLGVATRCWPMRCTVARRRLGLLRQALHATRLGLRHPITDQALSFDEPLPDDLLPAWSAVCD